MNACYEESLDENFNRALDLCSGNFSREELFSFLKSGNMPEKQFAALEIQTIEAETEADIFISNLTGCDGKIREAVAYKLNEIIKNNHQIFLAYPDILADATIDINANICRMVIESLYYLKNDKEFSDKYLKKIFQFIDEALEKLDSFIFRDKKYTINKQIFKLYWCLEGVNVFYQYIEETKLFNILKRCSEINEYTVREKVAIILKNDLKSDELRQLKLNLKSDSNYYVKNI